MDEYIGRPDENSFGNQAFSDTGSEDKNSSNFSNEKSKSEDAWGNNQAKKVANQASAQKDARDVESSAIEQGGNPNNAELAEQKPVETQSFYTGKNSEKDKKAKTKAKIKKLRVIGGILGILITLMVTFSAATPLAPFALVANGLEMYNSLRTSMNLRASYQMPRLLHGKLNHNITNHGIFGVQHERFNIKSAGNINKRLEKQGIKYVETTGTDGQPLNLLVYEDGPNGKPMAVAAYDGDKARIPSSVELTSLDASGNQVPKTIDLDTDNHFTYKEVKNNAATKSFTDAEDKATRTLKGHIAGWFDSAAEQVDKKLNNHGRNRMGSDSEDPSDEEIVKNAEKDGIAEEASSTQGDAKADSTNEIDPDETSPEPVGQGDDSLKPGMDAEAAKSALTKRAEKAAALIGKASQITAIANYSCSVIKVINQLSQTVGAMMKAKVLNFATTFLEAVDKAKAGDSRKELHYFMNNMNAQGPTYDRLGNVISGKEQSSAMASVATQQFFSNGQYRISPRDPVVEKFNPEAPLYQAVYNSDNIESRGMAGNLATLGTLFTQATGSLNVYKACIGVSLTADLLSLFGDVAGFFITGGLNKIVKNLILGFITVAQTAAITASVSGIIAFLIPTVSKALARNFLKKTPGEDQAYLLADGFNIYNTMQHRMSSGKPTTEENLNADYEAKQKVIASEARFARSTKSPFDVNSPYTFMGSLVSTMMPLASIMSTPLQVISKVGGITNTAFGSLLPSASAADRTKTLGSVNKNCPSANGGAKTLVMDAFCNNYITSDFASINVPIEDKAKEIGPENLDFESEADNPPIKDKSTFAKWSLACAARESPFNVADSNIANALQSGIGVGTGGVKQITGAILGATPVVGSYYQVKASAEDAANVKFATGEFCYSEEANKFSSYSEDLRVLESAGLIEKSAVTAYLDKYYEKHPLDHSDSGIVARYTGMSKEDAEISLGLLEYNIFLANYHPKEKGPELPAKLEDYQYESSSVIAEVLPSSLVTQFSNSSKQRLVTVAA